MHLANRDTSLVSNAWYMAALSEELSSEALFSRTILNVPLVLFRKRNGAPVAFKDRCPHRFAPLSLGKRNGDTLQCGYHGMVFDATGACIANPVCPNAPISDFARVPTLPIIERHRLIWIWMGTPERAKPEEIPNYFQYDHPEWAGATHQMVVNANYMLLADNLMDLSHVSFVHADILGNDDLINQDDSTTKSGDGSVSELRLVRDGKPT